MHSKIIIKLSVKSISFKFFFPYLQFVLSTLFSCEFLSDVKENKIKRALLCLVTCKLKCTGYMQTWTSFPHTVPRYCIFLWHFRKCKATCERMLFLSGVWYWSTLGQERRRKRRRRRKGEDQQIVQCISPCLLDSTHFLQFDCQLVGTLTCDH